MSRHQLRAATALGLLWAAGAPLPARAETLDCLIQPYVLAAVSSPVEGVLEKIHVDRGDLVKEGQVLATLEASVEKATEAMAAARATVESPYKSAEVRMDFGTRRFVRTEEMFKKEIIPLKDLDEAETAKILAEIGVQEAKENQKIAELELARARAVLGQRTIRSPVTGVVTERLLEAGEFVKGTPIVKVAQIHPLRVEVIAPVTLFGKIGLDTRAEILPEAPLNGTYSAKVTVVDRVVDAASGTFGVRLDLPNPNYRLPAGLKCKIRFR